jgi:hypothetical protein
VGGWLPFRTGAGPPTPRALGGRHDGGGRGEGGEKEDGGGRRWHGAAAKRTTTAPEAQPWREGDEGIRHREVDWMNDSDEEMDTDDAGDTAAPAPCFRLYRRLQKRRQRRQERRRW